MSENAASIVIDTPQLDTAQTGAHPEDIIMSSKETAKYLKTTPEQMVRLRRSGKGPAFGQAGYLIRYRKSVVDAWLASQIKTSKKQRRK